MAFRHTSRWTFTNVLPVAFVLGIIAIIWLTYVGFHLLRIHRIDEADPKLPQMNLVEVLVSQGLALIMMVCFVRAVMTDPGKVPDTEDWTRNSGNRRRGRGAAVEEVVISPLCHEVKQNGDRRFCNKCAKYKPDRCHHCRVCNSCVLRMDHHCPWIANCVGFRNHKYFFLLVFYCFLNCLFIVVSMASTVLASTNEEMDTTSRFAMVFGLTLAVIMGGLLGSFFTFHCWLNSQALTTIEFCEKTSNMSRAVFYDQGLFENLRAVLGPHVLLWLLPVSPPLGDGLTFLPQGESKVPASDMGDTLLSSKPEESEAPTAAREVTGAKEASV